MWSLKKWTPETLFFSFKIKGSVGFSLQALKLILHPQPMVLNWIWEGRKVFSNVNNCGILSSSSTGAHPLVPHLHGRFPARLEVPLGAQPARGAARLRGAGEDTSIAHTVGSGTSILQVRKKKSWISANCVHVHLCISKHLSPSRRYPPIFASPPLSVGFPPSSTHSNLQSFHSFPSSPLPLPPPPPLQEDTHPFLHPILVGWVSPFFHPFKSPLSLSFLFPPFMRRYPPILGPVIQQGFMGDACVHDG